MSVRVGGNRTERYTAACGTFYWPVTFYPQASLTVQLAIPTVYVPPLRGMLARGRAAQRQETQSLRWSERSGAPTASIYGCNLGLSSGTLVPPPGRTNGGFLRVS
jgi:hypothetical protein